MGLSDEALERELGPDVEEPTAKELSPAVLPGLPEAAVEGATRFTVVKGKSVSCRNSVKVGEIKASDVIGGEATLLDLESRGLVVRE